jgi:hypothetical protein
MPLNAASLNDFYIKGTFADLHFRKGDSGKIEGVELHTYSNRESLNKIVP